MGNRDSSEGKAKDKDPKKDDDASASDFCNKWRHHGYEYWNQEAVSAIRGEIDSIFKTLDSKGETKIIICGGTGEGKSSLINNLIAAISGSYSVVAPHGCQHNQVTKSYRQYYATKAEGGEMHKLPLIFADTRGFSGSRKLGASVAAIQACIMGKVANEEEIDLERVARQWLRRDDKTTKASFVFFVANATVVPENGNPKAVETHRDIYQNLTNIRKFCSSEHMGMASFLTNCDVLDDEVNNDVSNLYTSGMVQKKVEAFSKMIDIPLYRSYPIVNYSSETVVTNKMAMQALIPIKECLLDIRSRIFS